MELKWWILIGIVVMGIIIIGLYYSTFYKKKSLFKKKEEIDKELITIDGKKKSWILFSNTHLEYKKDKWLLFDNIILTDYCMYFLNDLTAMKKITSHEENQEWWTRVNEEGQEINFKNPIQLYDWQIKKLQKMTNFEVERKVILILDDQIPTFEFQKGFCLNLNQIQNLQAVIEKNEGQTSFAKTISMKEKKQFMLVLSNKTFATNKKNILDPIDQKVVIGGKKNDQQKFRK